MNIPFSSKSLGNNILKCIRDLASKPSIQAQTPEVSVGISNRTEHFGLIRSEYSGPGLKVVLFDQSGHFGRSDRNVRFRLTKLLSPVPLLCILLTRTITNARRLGSGLCNRNVPFHWARGISENSNRNFCSMESALGFNLKLKLIQNFKLKTKTYLIFTAVCLSSTQGYV